MYIDIDVKQSYDYTKEELNTILEDVIHSIIDSFLTFDQIKARGGV